MPSIEPSRLAIKIDVDTDRGTREGVLPLAEICRRQRAPATFLFSLGPDNTGKSLRRIFRPGFLKKVMRTNVAGNYGLRTLLNGTLLPAPDIGRRNADVMRRVRDLGFEVGIHCHDHFQWQDYLHRMSLDEIRREFGKAVGEFEEIFGAPPRTAGAPGWQCNERSLQVYDEAGLDYGSDTRGQSPFLPSVGEQVFKTPQLPTTLPTLDELLGRPEFPKETINGHYVDLLGKGGRHVHTIHAEIEGLRFAPMFEDLLTKARAAGVEFFSLAAWAETLRTPASGLPVCQVRDGGLEGRSGTVAIQGDCVATSPGLK
jgi:undecaprenyl phosphate-alpha-L-ara4FN deformylase